MKIRMLILLFAVFYVGVSVGQVSPSKIARVDYATTPFGENLAAGANIVNINTGRQYLFLLPVASTKSIATCTSSEIRDLSLWPLKRRIFGRYIDGSVNMDSTIIDQYIASAANWNAKESALTFSTGLLRTGNTITNTITNNNQLANGAGYITSASLPAVNDATLTLAVAGSGLSGSQTFTANQATGAAFTVTSNATTTNSASTIVLRDGSGYVSLTGTFCSSDSTLKKNIKPLSKVDLYNASKIDFMKFAFKADATEHLHYGVVAQDVEKLLPAVVSTSAETGKKEVNYTELLITIVAQQKETIERLEKRVTELENKEKVIGYGIGTILKQATDEK